MPRLTRRKALTDAPHRNRALDARPAPRRAPARLALNLCGLRRAGAAAHSRRAQEQPTSSSRRSRTWRTAPCAYLRHGSPPEQSARSPRWAARASKCADSTPAGGASPHPLSHLHRYPILTLFCQARAACAHPRTIQSVVRACRATPRALCSPSSKQQLDVRYHVRARVCAGRASEGVRRARADEARRARLGRAQTLCVSCSPRRKVKANFTFGQ
jgi:hypothetical protein